VSAQETSSRESISMSGGLNQGHKDVPYAELCACSMEDTEVLQRAGKLRCILP
jgi:hypothetical protein